MLDRPELAGHDPTSPHPQRAVPPDRQVSPHTFTQCDGDAELLFAFANQRNLITFPGIDLAAGELPEAGECRGLAPLRDQHAAGAVEQRNPNHDLPGHGGHHRAMPDQPALLSSADVESELRNLDGWSGDTTGIERTVECSSFPAAIELVRHVADVAEEMNHHPDIDIRWRKVRFAVSTHSAGGVTSYDVTLAGKINELASA